MTHDYMTTEEVAEHLRTTPATVRWWHSVGKGPASVRVGRRRLYARTDVKAWIEESRGIGAA